MRFVSGGTRPRRPGPAVRVRRPADATGEVSERSACTDRLELRALPQRRGFRAFMRSASAWRSSPTTLATDRRRSTDLTNVGLSAWCLDRREDDAAEWRSTPTPATRRRSTRAPCPEAGAVYALNALALAPCRPRCQTDEAIAPWQDRGSWASRRPHVRAQQRADTVARPRHYDPCEARGTAAPRDRSDSTQGTTTCRRGNGRLRVVQGELRSATRSPSRASTIRSAVTTHRRLVPAVQRRRHSRHPRGNFRRVCRTSDVPPPPPPPPQAQPFRSTATRTPRASSHRHSGPDPFQQGGTAISSLRHRGASWLTGLTSFVEPRSSSSRR